MANSLTIMTVINWHPLVPLPLITLLAALTLAGLWFLYTHVRTTARFHTLATLLILRAITMVLFIFALAQPLLQHYVTDQHARTVIVAIDTSPSMALPLTNNTTRLQHALTSLAKIQAAFPPTWQWIITPFSDTLYPPQSSPQLTTITTNTYTDISTALEQADRHAVAASAAAILMLSDGGDDPAPPQLTSTTPLVALAVGDHTLPSPDIALTSVIAPATVEKQTTFTIKAHITANGPPLFMQQAAALPLILLRHHADSEPQEIKRLTVDASSGSADANFEVECTELGQNIFTITTPHQPNEKFTVNNHRTIALNVRHSAVEILFYTHQIGADLKFLRQALASDTALRFTALYRSGENQYTIHGDAADSNTLSQGLPTTAEELRRYGALIIGSLPAEAWNAATITALLQYVENGGGLIWLGGENSFSSGGYTDSPLRPLIPWDPPHTGTPLFERGTFPITIAPTSHAATTGLAEMLRNATPAETTALAVTSLNRNGNLLPGALPLLQVTTPHATEPLAVEHRYGRGRIISIASNTTWLWARSSGIPARFYNNFWRQTIRAVSDSSNSSSHLQITWNRDSYRPGDPISIEFHTDTPNRTLRASLITPTGRSALTLDPQSETTWSSHWRHTSHQPTTIEATLEDNSQHLETLSLPIPQALPADESSQLLPNHAAFAHYIKSAGGTATTTPDHTIDALQQATAPQTTLHTFTPFITPWPLLLLALTITIELTLRRRHGLL
ncbi:MAG: hypothetical protein GX230_06775 [Lentisphaerae bacterium]|nr:hypothetical protein [Lentisphaerota bacterium]